MTDPRSSAPRPTPLTALHEELGATLVDFAGWRMPLRYSSETAEHRAVRSAAGLFDLSHMGELAVTGPGAAAALDYALVGHLSAVQPGRARYTMICADNGGVLDDLIVYRLADTEFLVVSNAVNTGGVLRALRERAAGRDATVADRTADYALIAIQGPRAAAILAPHTDARLDAVRYYASYRASVAGCPALLARTGYTGEDGFEIFAGPQHAERIWAALRAAGGPEGLAPAGLAARDTLRLEAGMPLYGNELSPDVTPYDAGLGRVVRLDKPGDFVGRAALARRAGAQPERVLIGLMARSRRVPRHGYRVLLRGRTCGHVTSGAPSPTLGTPIAMAYVDPQAARDGGAGAGAVSAGGTSSGDTSSGDTSSGGAGAEVGLAVDIRGRAEPAVLTALPFYRRAS